MTMRNNSFCVFTFMLTLVFSTLAWAGKPVNVNEADAQTLADSLDGIGLKKAQAMVDYRMKNGPFKAAEDLSNVKGVGEKTVAKNAEYIKL